MKHDFSKAPKEDRDEEQAMAKQTAYMKSPKN